MVASHGIVVNHGKNVQRRTSNVQLRSWLRLDPTDTPDARVEVDYIRFIPRRG